MSEKINMSNDFLIHQYLDTGLDADGEQTLFAALAGDPVLRREFGHQLNLKNIVEEESRRVTPPAALSSAIFGELGYAIPAGLATTASAVPFIHRLFPILGTIASLIFVGLLSVASPGESEGDTQASSLLFVAESNSNAESLLALEGEQGGAGAGGNNTYINGGSNIDGYSSDNMNINPQQLALIQDSLVMIKAELDRAFNDIETKERLLTIARNRQTNSRNSFNTGNGSSLQGNSNLSASLLGDGANGMPMNGQSKGDKLLAFDMNFDDINGGDDGKSLSFIDRLAASVKQKLSEVMASEEYRNSIKDDSSAKDGAENKLAASRSSKLESEGIYVSESNPYPLSEFGDIMVTVSYVQTNSTPDISLGGADFPISADVSMNLNGYFSVVADLGAESYGQSFSFMQNGREVIRNQNPTVYYYTAGVRANTPYFFGSLMPYVQLTGGGSSFGPVARANAGVMFRTNQRLSMNLGYEGSMLWYAVDGNLLNSTNNGFSVGIVYHF